MSNEFISIARQVPKKKTILPLTLQGVDTSSVHMDTKEFLIEPSVTEVFDALLPHYLENQVRDAMLQAEASEHSARMLAMHNATENAKSLSQELTLVYNRARQEKSRMKLPIWLQPDLLSNTFDTKKEISYVKKIRQFSAIQEL